MANSLFDNMSGTSINSPFKLQRNKPLDLRSVVSNYSDLALLASGNAVYEGMSVWVTTDKKCYRYIDGSWVEDITDVSSATGVPLAICNSESGANQYEITVNSITTLKDGQRVQVKFVNGLVPDMFNDGGIFLVLNNIKHTIKFLGAENKTIDRQNYGIGFVICPENGILTLTYNAAIESWIIGEGYSTYAAASGTAESISDRIVTMNSLADDVIAAINSSSEVSITDGAITRPKLEENLRNAICPDPLGIYPTDSYYVCLTDTSTAVKELTSNSIGGLDPSKLSEIRDGQAIHVYFTLGLTPHEDGIYLKTSSSLIRPVVLSAFGDTYKEITTANYGSSRLYASRTTLCLVYYESLECWVIHRAGSIEASRYAAKAGSVSDGVITMDSLADGVKSKLNYGNVTVAESLPTAGSSYVDKLYLVNNTLYQCIYSTSSTSTNKFTYVWQELSYKNDPIPIAGVNSIGGIKLHKSSDGGHPTNASGLVVEDDGDMRVNVDTNKFYIDATGVIRLKNGAVSSRNIESDAVTWAKCDDDLKERIRNAGVSSSSHYDDDSVTPTTDGIFIFDTNDETMTATLVSYTGSSAVDTLVVPYEYTENGKTYNVTAIGRGTAAADIVIDSEYVTTVILPNTITAIGAFAFYMADVENVSIPNSVLTIGNSAFRSSDLERVTIPESTTSIGVGAFASCAALKTVNFNAKACTTMGNASNYVFNACSALDTVNIGKTVTIIPSYAFAGLTALKKVNIAHGVTIIRNLAFTECTALKNVVIPNSVTTLENAFSGCSSLSYIVIPENVAAFYSSGNLYWNCSDNLVIYCVKDSAIDTYAASHPINNNGDHPTVQHMSVLEAALLDGYIHR